MTPMRKALGSVGLMLTFALFLTSAAHGQKKGAKATKDQVATDQDYTQLNQIKDLTGKIVSVEGSTKVFILKVEYQYLEPKPNAGRGNPNLQRQQQSIIRQQQQIMRTRNPVHRLQQMQHLVNQLQQQQLRGLINLNNMFKVTTAKKSFELQAKDGVKVRRQNLPTEYDDKGNIKEYTAEEKKKLRGDDPKLPGYEAKWEDVGPNQTVKVYLVKKKPPKKEEGSQKDTAADKENKDTPDPSAKERAPEVWLILIQREADSAAVADQPRKKKINN
jgi:hypothetical protein